MRGRLIDLVISDIMMPGTDGFAFAARLRELDERLPNHDRPRHLRGAHRRSTILPIYMQRMAGASVTISALVMLPGSLVMAVSSPITGRVYDRFGIRPLAVVGMELLAVTMVPFGLLTAHTPIWRIAVAGFVMSLVCCCRR